MTFPVSTRPGFCVHLQDLRGITDHEPHDPDAYGSDPAATALGRANDAVKRASAHPRKARRKHLDAPTGTLDGRTRDHRVSSGAAERVRGRTQGESHV